jgi:protein-disulfide isomerase
MNKFIYKILFFLLITFSVNAENKILSIGSVNAKVTVKVFSSLTCPHCANFHENIFDELK